jgi:hypothetical protein
VKSRDIIRFVVSGSELFEELGEFVGDDVRVNDAPHGFGRYGAGLREQAQAFPTSTGSRGIC